MKKKRPGQRALDFRKPLGNQLESLLQRMEERFGILPEAAGSKTKLTLGELQQLCALLDRAPYSGPPLEEKDWLLLSNDLVKAACIVFGGQVESITLA